MLHLPGGRPQGEQAIRVDAELVSGCESTRRLQPRVLSGMHPELALLAHRRSERGCVRPLVTHR